MFFGSTGMSAAISLNINSQKKSAQP